MSFFRAAFLLLVFANFAFFAWAQGYFGATGQGFEPQRLTNQLAADKLKIVVAQAGDKPGPAPAAEACRLVTGLPPGEAEAFKAALAGLAVDIKPAEATTSYWVHIPPQASKAAADKKAAELKALGIQDFYVVQDEGASRLAISLGLFKSEATAGEFLQGLARRGVKSARIEVREAASQPVRAIVKGPGGDIDRRLPGVLAKTPGAAMAECP